MEKEVVDKQRRNRAFNNSDKARARRAVAQTRPERQEPQRTDNINKMAAVYDSAVFQRVTAGLTLAEPELQPES